MTVLYMYVLVYIFPFTVATHQANMPCLKTPRPCSHFCLSLSPLKFKCTCPVGLTIASNNRTCMKTFTEYFIYYFDKRERSILLLTNVSTVDKQSKTLVNYTINTNQSVALAYDNDNHTMYISDISNKILKVDTRMGKSTIILSGIKAKSIAYDSRHKLLFWIDSIRKTVGVYEQSTSYNLKFISYGLNNPQEVEVYPQKRLLFIIDWDKKSKIEQLGLDGNNRKIVAGNIPGNEIIKPSGLAVDHVEGKLYYADRYLDRIMAYDVNTKKTKLILAYASGSHLRDPVRLAVFKEEVLWTDLESRGIFKFNKRFGVGEKIVKGDLDEQGAVVVFELKPTNEYKKIYIFSYASSKCRPSCDLQSLKEIQVPNCPTGYNSTGESYGCYMCSNFINLYFGRRCVCEDWGSCAHRINEESPCGSDNPYLHLGVRECVMTIRPGYCNAMYGSHCPLRDTSNGCSADQDCQENYKCCKTECGHQCIAPSPTPPDILKEPCQMLDASCRKSCYRINPYTDRCSCPRVLTVIPDGFCVNKTKQFVMYYTNGFLRNLYRYQRLAQPTSYVIQNVSASSNASGVVSITMDIENNFIYWSNVQDRVIVRMHVKGTKYEIIKNDVHSYGVAFNNIDKSLFWTDKQRKRIFTSKPNGTYQQTVGDFVFFFDPREIAIHSRKSLLYVIDFSLYAKIVQIRTDGRDRKVITKRSGNEGVLAPAGLAIDAVEEKLYYADQRMNKIAVFDILTNKISVLLTGLQPSSVFVFKENMYWMNKAKQGIFTRNKRHGNEASLIEGNLSSPIDLYLYEESETDDFKRIYKFVANRLNCATTCNSVLSLNISLPDCPPGYRKTRDYVGCYNTRCSSQASAPYCSCQDWGTCLARKEIKISCPFYLPQIQFGVRECTQTVRPGYCNISYNCTTQKRNDSCYGDQDCPGKEKCCDTSCGNKCKVPLKHPDSDARCSTLRIPCSHFCSQISISKIQCSCPLTMALNADGRTCVDRPADFEIIFNDRKGKLYRFRKYVNPSTTTSNLLYSPSYVRKINAIAYNQDEDMLYWSESNKLQVCGMHPNGSNFQVMVAGVFSRGLAFDPVYRFLYIANRYNKSVILVSATRTIKATIVDTGLNNPEDVEVYSPRNLLFVADGASMGKSGKIEQMNLDGSNRKTIAGNSNTYITSPQALNFDHSEERLYYIDAYLNKMSSYDINSGKTYIITTPSLAPRFQPVADVAVYRDRIFWTIPNWSNSLQAPKNFPGYYSALFYFESPRHFVVYSEVVKEEHKRIYTFAYPKVPCASNCFTSTLSTIRYPACPPGYRITMEKKNCYNCYKSFPHYSRLRCSCIDWASCSHMQAHISPCHNNQKYLHLAARECTQTIRSGYCNFPDQLSCKPFEKRRSSCYADQDCTGKKKCCETLCGKQCTIPLKKPPSKPLCGIPLKQCSHTCLQLSGVAFKCSCPLGMVLEKDGKTCKNISADWNIIYATKDNGGKLYIMKKFSASLKLDALPVPDNTLSHPTALTYDKNKSMLYWSDTSTKQIIRISMNGSNFKVLIQDTYCYGLTFESFGRSLIWADRDRKQIRALKLEDVITITLVSTGLEDPVNVEVYSEKGFLFVADMGNTPKIEQMYTDGSNRKIITGTTVENKVNLPFGLAIDRVEERLYYVDTYYQKIVSYDIDKGITIVLLDTSTSSYLRKPFGLSLYKDYVYWTDWGSQGIYRVHKGGSNATRLVNLKDPMGIYVYSEIATNDYHRTYSFAYENKSCYHNCKSELFLGLKVANCTRGYHETREKRGCYRCMKQRIYRSGRGCNCTDWASCAFELYRDSPCSSGSPYLHLIAKECVKTIRPGYCESTLGEKSRETTKDVCDGDQQCPEEQKCCKTACGNRCVPPLSLPSKLHPCEEKAKTCDICLPMPNAGYRCLCPKGKALDADNETCTTIGERCRKGGPCLQPGSCIVTSLGVQCICSPEYTGRYCESYQCSPGSCHNGGTCTAKGNDFECSCPIQWMGKTCSQTRLCESSKCNNQGTCYYGTDGKETCNCTDAFTGEHCLVLKACQSNPCKNSGHCVRGSGTSYKCLCPDGFTGDLCQILITCQSNSCKNSGKCVRGSGTSYKCLCPDGFTGDLCQILIACQSNPCKNNGTCVKGSGLGYKCSCPDPFIGNECQTKKFCFPDNPCKHGGLCSNDNGGSCVCKSRYTGSNCESEICSNLKCQNNGFCEKEDPSACTCRRHYAGKYCTVYTKNHLTKMRLKPGKRGPITVIEFQKACAKAFTLYCKTRQCTKITSRKKRDADNSEPLTFSPSQIIVSKGYPIFLPNGDQEFEFTVAMPSTSTGTDMKLLTLPVIHQAVEMAAIVVENELQATITVVIVKPETTPSTHQTAKPPAKSSSVAVTVGSVAAVIVVLILIILVVFVYRRRGRPSLAMPDTVVNDENVTSLANPAYSMEELPDMGNALVRQFSTKSLINDSSSLHIYEPPQSTFDMSKLNDEQQVTKEYSAYGVPKSQGRATQGDTQESFT